VNKKCPRQQAFETSLLLLLAARDDYNEDRENSEKAEFYIKEYRRFINNWCPALKDYEAF